MSKVQGPFNIIHEAPPATGMRLLFRCPGCNLVHGPSVGEGPGPRWGWNNSYDKATFTPSLLVRWTQHEPPVTAENAEQFRANPWSQQPVERICHSFITDGQIQFLGDCTHALAGKTVPLPETFSWGDE